MSAMLLMPNCCRLVAREAIDDVFKSTGWWKIPLLARTWPVVFILRPQHSRKLTDRWRAPTLKFSPRGGVKGGLLFCSPAQRTLVAPG